MGDVQQRMYCICHSLGIPVLLGYYVFVGESLEISSWSGFLYCFDIIKLCIQFLAITINMSSAVCTRLYFLNIRSESRNYVSSYKP